MKKYTFIILVNILLFNFSLFAKNTPTPSDDSNYSIYNISAELLKDANAVVRMDYTSFELKSKNNATVTRKYAITILNNNADSYAQFREYYDDFTKIKSIKGVIYDKNGKVIKKIKKKEVNDVSAVSNISLIEDTRMKYIEVLQNNYPFTIEFEFKKEFSGMLSYPRWIPVGGYKMAVEQSTYIAKIPNKLGMRYLVKNFSNEPEITSEDDSKIYTWNVENFQAIDSEPYGPDYRNFLPMVYLSPNEFEYDGYSGNMETWESFGKWLKRLEEGRDELKKETVQKVNELVAGADSEEEKSYNSFEYKLQL